MCRMEKWFEDADWIRLTQDKVRWWAFFVYGSELNFGFHKSRENCSGSENEWRRPTWVKYGQMHPSLSTLYISFPAPWRGRVIAPRVLNLGSRWRCVVAITPLLPENNWRLARSKSQSGRSGEEKNISPTGFRTLDRAASNPVAEPPAWASHSVVEKETQRSDWRTTKSCFNVRFKVSTWVNIRMTVLWCRAVWWIYTNNSEELAVSVYRLQTLAGI